MISEFTPIVNTEPIRVIQVTKPARISNMPPSGTLMRATLGDTQILFRFNWASDSIAAFHGQIVGPGHDGFRDITFWPEVPWTFEILDQIEPTA